MEHGLLDEAPSEGAPSVQGRRGGVAVHWALLLGLLGASASVALARHATHPAITSTLLTGRVGELDEDGMKAGLLNVNGAVLSYAERQAADGNSDLPVLFLHGYLDSWKSWTNVLPHFPAGRRLISLTHRGWGDSAKTGTYSIDAYAADVADFLSALGIDRCILVGHSMGTLISTAVAARHPDLVAGAVLVSAAAKVLPKHVIDAQGDTTASLGRQIDSLFADDHRTTAAGVAFLKSFQLADLKPFLATGAVTKEFEQQVMQETMKATPRSYRDAWQNMLEEDHTSELATIEKPVLIIHGGQDYLFDAYVQEQLRIALARASVTSRSIPDAPHGVIWTSGPTCAKMIQHWLITCGL